LESVGNLQAVLVLEKLEIFDEKCIKKQVIAGRHTGHVKDLSGMQLQKTPGGDGSAWAGNTSVNVVKKRARKEPE